jgi:hypothetical protein
MLLKQMLLKQIVFDKMLLEQMLLGQKGQLHFFRLKKVNRNWRPILKESIND